MLFDTAHILFMVLSVLVIAGLMVLFHFTLKTDKQKDLVLKVFAILTLFFHFSSLWVDYFTTGTAVVDSAMLLPIYPCHITMWLLVIFAFSRNKKSKGFTMLAEATFYLGIFGGVLGIGLNEIYSRNPNMLDYDVLKGLLSHDTMLVGCIYLLVGGYMKIRVSNMMSICIGLVGLVVDGGIVIGLYKWAGLNPPNSMFLLENPFPKIPWFNTWVLGLLAIVVLFGFTALYELIALKKEDRWYTKIKQYLNNKKNKEEVEK